MTILVLVTLLFLARNVLFNSDGSAYGTVVRFEQAYGYVISRATGLARMAAVPAIIGFVLVVSFRAWTRVLGAVMLSAALYVLWIMQARGALVAAAGAVTFVFLFGPRKGQKFVAALVALVAFAGFLILRGESFGEFWMHVTRNQGAEGFASMSGRTLLFVNGFDHWMHAPVFGYGPQADRSFLDVINAQNALLYALLCGGLVGAGGFVAAMVVAWVAMLRVNVGYQRIAPRDRPMLMITSGILVFSTFRSIVENQAAVFSIDLLLQYPAMIYLVLLHAASRCPRPVIPPARGHHSSAYRDSALPKTGIANDALARKRAGVTLLPMRNL
ncbi:O-antigen ligase family protein [Jiella sp. MQZ9-1]|uniref:O-antigen ligase family protein n=1 Tax=Jiella flava TaxID=2816857 RepID=A0A939FZW5_9HYPH|nr:O-antigen ligase family protein [Jiella flava]MBO0662459.1 O-antigen ligase family protein [Jiella flava]MCD2471684.1 O-antigen ligase family protein [Jiella flava]